MERSADQVKGALADASLKNQALVQKIGLVLESFKYQGRCLIEDRPYNYG